jgi:mycothiol synthase
LGTSREGNVEIEPRSYRAETDLVKIGDLLRAGLVAANGSHYDHIGNLYWTLYYASDENVVKNLSLWDDPGHAERIMAWALFEPGWGAFYVFLQPELRQSPLAETIYTWAEEHISGLVHLAGQEAIHTDYIANQDEVAITRLLARGYQRTPADTVYMMRSLTDPLPQPALPDGYTVRGCRGEAEVIARAMPQYSAFDNSMPFERYVARFRGFMQSPVYDPELDVVAVNPDGRIDSFCIVWPDPLIKVGLFEPVGTHPDYQRRGLGKAVMSEALRRLQRRGMERAIVSTTAKNIAGIRLYEAVGFRIIQRLGTYEKKLT